MKTRIEQDSMGTMRVPGDAYFGASTMRSLSNFSISNGSWYPSLISSIVLLKTACAKANGKLGLLEGRKVRAIVQACNQVLDGKLADQFPLDVFQAGSGTSTNMNVNEVIGNRASELLGGKKGDKKVHPNDDVNKGQSTNNVIPSAIRVASAIEVEGLVDVLLRLVKALKKKGAAFSSVLKSGRTHLQDAVPMRLGQEFDAYAAALDKHVPRLRSVQAALLVLGIGGNAVGTGLNTSPKFRALIISYLNKEVPLKFTMSGDGVESTQFLTDILALSSVLKLIAVDLHKICNDLRLLSSGPKTGLHEINLPAVEPGSSIMPGKINPSICEAVNMVCCKIVGNDSAMTMACSGGNLELNTHMPLVGDCIIESLGILTSAMSTLREKCIVGITANEDQCAWYVEHSLSLGTALNPYLGYDVVADLVKEAQKTGKTVKALVLEKNLMPKHELYKILDPKRLTRPNL